MPFTLSHPAAVLPLRRFSRLPFAALVAGSVAPDTGYFFSPTPWFREDAHTIARSFTYCVPAGLALLLVFTLLRGGFLSLLPGGIREACDGLCEENPFLLRRLPFTVLAVLLGAWTHLFWDSWTHFDGYFVVRVSLFHGSLLGVPIHRYLQLGSSALGAAAIAVFLCAEARQRGHKIRLAWSWRWVFWGGACLLAGTVTFFTRTLPWNYVLSANEHRLFFLTIFTMMRNMAALCIVAALTLTVADKRSVRP